MSSIVRRLGLLALVFTGLCGLEIGARAEQKVDWSSYLEPPGYKAPKKVSPTPAPVAAAPAKKPTAKAAKPRAESRAKPAKRKAGKR